MKKIKVYIAGPYTVGDVGVNVKTAMDYGEQCMKAGLVPFIPHLTHYQHIAHPHTYDEWMSYDIEWLKTCDAVLRIPGESKGADYEVEIAKHRDMPVFYNMFDLIQYKNGKLPWEMHEVSTVYSGGMFSAFRAPSTSKETEDDALYGRIQGMHVGNIDSIQRYYNNNIISMRQLFNIINKKYNAG